jgi:hypothetical protein
MNKRCVDLVNESWSKHVRLINISTFAAYLGAPRFKSQPRDGYPDIIFVIFLGCFSQMLG